MCDDYMSDEILKLATEVDQKNNVRKKIMKRRGEAGEIDKTQPLSKKRIQEMMEEKTEEGMEKAIDSTNKGYQLLQRFGYTEGAGLGKNNSGIENPLKITKREKSDRSGLGVEGDTLRLKQKMKEKVSDFLRETDLEAGFLAGVKHKKRCQQMKYEIHSCESAIENLDTRANVSRHNLWPPALDLEEKNEANGEEIAANEPIESIQTKQDRYLHDLERLQLCIQYLRSSYRYCVYCGNDYDNWEDMEENCPGPLKEDHDS